MYLSLKGLLRLAGYSTSIRKKLVWFHSDTKPALLVGLEYAEFIPYISIFSPEN